MKNAQKINVINGIKKKQKAKKQKKITVALNLCEHSVKRKKSPIVKYHC